MEDPIRTEYLRESAATFRKYKTMADQSLARVTDPHFFDIPVSMK
jgi:hypothetical protein